MSFRRSDQRRTGDGHSSEMSNNSNPSSTRKRLLFPFLLLIALTAYSFPRRYFSEVSDISAAVKITSCLCEGSHGPGSPHVPHYLGTIGKNSYGCTDSRLRSSSVLSICLTVNLPKEFGISGISELNMTHLESGSSTTVHTRADIYQSPSHVLMVMPSPLLNDDWYHSYADSLINIRGDILIHHMGGGSLQRILHKNHEIKKGFLLTAQTAATSFPVKSTICACSPVLGVAPESIGYIIRPNFNTVSYKCNEGNTVVKGVPTNICMSLRGRDAKKSHRLQSLLAFNVTHPTTKSIVQSIHPLSEKAAS